MIDMSLLREQPEKIIAALHKKDPSYDVQKLLNSYNTLNSVRQKVDDLRCKKNDLADQAKSGVTEGIRAQSIELGKTLKDAEKEVEILEQEFKDIYLRCPNIPLDDVPVGNKESNVVVRTFGEKAQFNFPVKNHVELGEALDWFDFQAAARMTASNFVFYKNDSVKLMYALTMFMLKNNMKHGFSPMIPPYLINETSLEVAGNFPKFRDQAFEVTADQLFLSPTSEVNLTNIYRDQIIEAAQMPMRMTAWSSCFRREAGGYGATERGLIRIHQFEKVELYTICDPENSSQEQERMMACAEDILQQLGLHYRVSLLAGQDCSFQSAKTYDIEVWMPGQGAYYEVSSCSNCTDFQSRRGKIRYRSYAGAKPQLVHMLNCSSLALPRLIVALMETYQQEDGTITLPEILKGYGIW